MSHTQPTLALEVTADSLALFSIDDGIPRECLGAVSREDAAALDLISKLADTGRSDRRSPCEIWLDSDQVIYRKTKLPLHDVSKSRDVAASALAATTAHRPDSLCFDVGEPDLDGYTPVAAIAKSTMDDALALARAMEMTPVRVTTSDDMTGFQVRPTFAAYQKPAEAHVPLARAAGLAALIALPLLGLLGFWTGQSGLFAQEERPLIAAVVTSGEPISEVAPVVLPDLGFDELASPSMRGAPDEPAVVEPFSDSALTPSMIPAAPRPQEGFFRQTAVVELDEIERLPSTNARLAPLSDPPDLGPAPELPRDLVEDRIRQDAAMLERSAAVLETGSPIVFLAAIEEPEPDPSVRARANFTKYFDDTEAYQVANIPSGILVRRPAARTRTFTPPPADVTRARPPDRPREVAPAEASDFARPAELAPYADPSDPSPTAPENMIARRPGSGAPLPLSAHERPGLLLLPGIAEEEAREAAIVAARRTIGMPGSILPPPRQRDYQVGPSSASARILFRMRMELRPLSEEPGPALPLGVEAAPSKAATPTFPTGPAEDAPVIRASVEQPLDTVPEPDTRLVRAIPATRPGSGVALPRAAARPVPETGSDTAARTDTETAAGPQVAEPEGPALAPAPRRPVAADVAPAQVAPREPSAPDAGDDTAVADAAAEPTTDTPEDIAAAIPPPTPGPADPAAATTAGAPAPDEGPTRLILGGSADDVIPDAARTVAARRAAPIPPRRLGTAAPVPATPEGTITSTVPPTRLAALAPRPTAPPDAGSARTARTVPPTRTAPDTAATPPRDQTTAGRTPPPSRPPVRVAITPPTPDTTAEAGTEADAAPPADGVAVLRPVRRPSGFESTVAQIRKARDAAEARVAARQEAPARTTPRDQLQIPARARVGQVATIEDGINLGDVSLIGIFGKSSARRALIRLPQGRIIRVSNGGKIRGWTVSAISDDAVRIQRRGENRVLRLPN